MNKANIRLRASSSERWINCPGSARLEHGIPDIPSKYAEEGILAHQLAADILNSPTRKLRDFVNRSVAHKVIFNENEGMFIEVGKYLEYIENIIAYIDAKLEYTYELPNINNQLLLIERKVDFSYVLPNAADATGTCDTLIIDDIGKVLHIIDLKYGKGVKVDVENNTQLLLYTLGVINDLQFLYDIEQITLHIVQPRIDNFQHQDLTIKELEPWKEFFIEKSQAALAINAPRIPNQRWCKFCKAKTICPEYQKFNKPFSIDEFDTLTTINQEN